MSDAPNYTPGTSFATDESNSVAGRSTVKTVSLDVELANASSSINAINTNLKKIQRDDGKVKDGLIEPYALSTQTRALLVGKGTARGNWEQDADYLVGESVQHSNIAQICLQDHNSGSIFTQSLWMPISDDGTAAAAAAAAAASAVLADASADAADVSEANALASANTATTQAGIATTQATNASNSAAAASALIAGSISGASQAEAEAGTNNTKFMSALRVKQAILALFPSLFPLLFDDIKSFAAVHNTPSNAVTITLPAGSLQFRSSTLASGTPVMRTNASVDTLVLPANATLGAVSNVASRIVILAVDNGSGFNTAIVNLAGGLNLDETGLITTVAISSTSNSANVIYSASVLTNRPYRVVGFYDETQTVAGTHSAPLTLVQGAGGNLILNSPSSIRVNTSNGHGSVNNTILRFTTTAQNVGNAITYADSATLGNSFTINKSGIYTVSLTCRPGLANAVFGVSINSNQLTTAIGGITLANRLCLSQSYVSNATINCSATVYMVAGDVVRVHTDGGAVNTDAQFNIAEA